CTFHSTQGKDKRNGDIAHVDGTLVFRGNSAVSDHGRIVVGDTASAIVDGNVFERRQESRPVLFGGTPERVRFSNNIVRNAGGAIAPALNAGALASGNILTTE